MENNTQTASNPTVSEAANKAVSSIESTQSQAPVNQPAVQTQTQAQTQTPTTQNQTFDPKLIESDPNLQLAYKQMQSDYTTKMQSIAQKEAQYKGYEQYVPIIQEMLSNKKAQTNPVVLGVEKELKEAGYNDEAIEVGKVIADKIISQINQTQERDKTISNVENQLSEVAKLDPRLNDKSLVYNYDDGQATFGEIVENLVAADPNWVNEPSVAVQRAIKKLDAMINTSKNQGKQELSVQASQKSQKFAPTQSSNQSTANANENLSLRDAFELAAKETGF